MSFFSWALATRMPFAGLGSPRLTTCFVDERQAFASSGRKGGGVAAHPCAYAELGRPWPKPGPPRLDEERSAENGTILMDLKPSFDRYDEMTTDIR